MLVILRENVENLGRIGDLVKVSDGYARNFLLPRKLVAAADEHNIAAVENQKKQLAKKRQAQVAFAGELAKKLEQHVCTITRKVGEGDRLFGSVTGHDIADLLKKAGFDMIERRMITIERPIKTLGMHTVTAKLDNEVSAEVKVNVVKEEG